MPAPTPEKPSQQDPENAGRAGEPDLSTQLHPAAREIHRDQTLWVVDKPAGVLSHPNPPTGQAPNTILRAPYDFERELYRVSVPGFRQRQVHLVHRLDLETSGILLLTFDASSSAALKEAFFHREVSKEYRALVVGSPREPRGEWQDSLQKVSKGGRAVVTAARGRINAVTRYAVLERFKKQGLTLLALWPETGRTHQLRVQTSSRGLSIAGDEHYGDRAVNRRLAEEIGLRHMFLHASRIELRHPRTGHLLKLEAPFSSRLSAPLERLRGGSAPG